METPTGTVEIRFVAENDYGILDHTIIMPDGQEVLNPMRVLGNEDGSEVLFTLFQRLGVSEDEFHNDLQMVCDDLQKLKMLLESQE